MLPAREVQPLHDGWLVNGLVLEHPVGVRTHAIACWLARAPYYAF
jgi:hypothetical protein